MALFLDHFQVLAEAPDGVASLREKILQLAVMGKLVPREPGDEPASVLLEKIRKEKAQLIKAGKIKESKPLPPIKKEEIPYELPKGWAWVRLGDICEYIQRGKGPKYVEISNIPVISQKCIQWSGFDIKKARFIDPTSLLYYGEERFLRSGDLLWNSTGTGTIGRITVYNHEENQYDKVVADSHVTVIRPVQIYPQFICVFLSSPFIQNNIEDRASGTTKQIELNTSTVIEQTIPLPPLNEQKRIVERVDRLLALCDDLEKNKEKRIDKQVSLNNASLEKLLSARAPEEFQEWWRFIARNFDVLYAHPGNVAKLKQAVLQLAVMGKLVPQEPGDEPASVLLEKIRKEKDRLIKAGTIKKPKPLPPIKKEEIPYELPQGWAWVRLNDICEIITKGSSPKWQGINYTAKRDGILFITSENVGNFSLRLQKTKYVEKKFNEIEPRSILKKNDLLMNIVGASIGRTTIYTLDEIANINQAVCLIRILKQETYISLDYLLQYFNNPFCLDMMFDKQVESARANLSMGNISEFLIPLPPLNEQRRIVQRVEELLGLCDRLEETLRKLQSTSRQFCKATKKEG